MAREGLGTPFLVGKSAIFKKARHREKDSILHYGDIIVSVFNKKSILTN